MTYHLRAALLAGAALFATQGAAQEVLAFGTANPDQHPLVTRILGPWVDAINQDAGDLFQIELRNGTMMVNHVNFYDRLQDDVVQMVWGVTSFDAGRFPRSQVTTMPFTVDSAEQGATAACYLAEGGHLAGDLDGIVPLLFVQFPQAALHFNGAPVTAMEDLAGKKVMVGSSAVADIAQEYGGTPLSIPVTEMYQALQRGTADATAMNYTAFPAFRLHEVTTDHLQVPLGGTLGMVFMMEDRFNALSPEIQNVLKAHAGCDTTRAVNQEMDRWEMDAMGFVRGQEGHTFTEPTAEQLAELTARIGSSVEEKFAASLEGGAALIEAFHEALARVDAE